MKNKKSKKSKVQTDNDHINLDEEIIIGMSNNSDNKTRKKKTRKSKNNIENDIRNSKKNNKQNNIKTSKKNNKQNDIRNSKKNIKQNDIRNSEKNKKQYDIKNNKKNKNQNNKKNKVKNVVLKFCIFILVAGSIISFLLLSPFFNITNIEVWNNQDISSDKIISLSQIHIGDNIFRFSKSKIRQNILENPYINDVKITRILPNSVALTVEERSSKFAIEFGGSYIYVSNQGYLLEVSKERNNLIILTGLQTEIDNSKVGQRLEIEDLKRIDTILKIIDAMNANDMENLITEVNIEDSSDFVVTIESKDKIIHLGDESELNVKMLYLKEILKQEDGKKGEAFINDVSSSKNVRFKESI